MASIILAFAFLFGGSSLAGMADTGVPSAGSFTYAGAPPAAMAGATIVASR